LLTTKWNGNIPRWLQRKDHKFLSCSPFPCFGYRLFGRVFAGHGGSPPLFPDPATGFAASESSPGLSGGTADGSLCRDSVRCPTCCTAAGVDPPGTFRQLPVFGTVTQRSVARYILLCSPFRLFCVVFSICFHLLPPAWDTREILYRAPARYTEVSAEACLAHARRIPGRVAYTCWQALEKCFDYEMKNTEIRASIAARNGIRAQISGIFWEQKCSFPRSNRGSVVSAGSFRGFPAGEPRFIKKGTGQRRASSDRYAPGLGAMRTARGGRHGSSVQRLPKKIKKKFRPETAHYLRNLKIGSMCA